MSFSVIGRGFKVRAGVHRSRKVQLRFSWRPNLKDESDNKFVEAAIRAAVVIVTYNVRDFRSPDILE